MHSFAIFNNQRTDITVGTGIGVPMQVGQRIATLNGVRQSTHDKALKKRNRPILWLTIGIFPLFLHIVVRYLEHFPSSNLTRCPTGYPTRNKIGPTRSTRPEPPQRLLQNKPMRLKYQLFITLLIASAILVAMMFVVSSLSFSRGFLGYINNADDQRLAALVPELEQQYANDGSWDNTATDSGVRSVLRSARGENKNKKSNRKPPIHNGRPRPPPPHARIAKRLVLTDANNQVLHGHISKTHEPNWQEITHNNEIVGYVGLNRLTRLEDQFDQAFEREQKKSFALAGLSMVMLSAILAVPLASRIVKPILKVSKTVAEISDGNYAHRISTQRQDEIGELANDINKLGQTLESNRGTRRRHFAEISHELRTPVAVLQAELEALQDGIRDLDSNSVNSLHTETVKLKRLIEDLHTLSLADTGALDYKLQPLDLTEVVQMHINSLNAKNIGTNQPGILDITISADQNNVSFNWADSAPGVATDALSKLFDPLFRGEASRNREHGGSGLGLSIVKKIVDAHSGTCEAVHSEHGGLEVKINFARSGHL